MFETLNGSFNKIVIMKTFFVCDSDYSMLFLSKQNMLVLQVPNCLLPLQIIALRGDL